MRKAATGHVSGREPKEMGTSQPCAEILKELAGDALPFHPISAHDRINTSMAAVRQTAADILKMMSTPFTRSEA